MSSHGLLSICHAMIAILLTCSDLAGSGGVTRVLKISSKCADLLHHWSLDAYSPLQGTEAPEGKAPEVLAINSSKTYCFLMEAGEVGTIASIIFRGNGGGLAI